MKILIEDATVNSLQILDLCKKFSETKILQMRHQKRGLLPQLPLDRHSHVLSGSSLRCQAPFPCPNPAILPNLLTPPDQNLLTCRIHRLPVCRNFHLPRHRLHRKPVPPGRIRPASVWPRRLSSAAHRFLLPRSDSRT